MEQSAPLSLDTPIVNRDGTPRPEYVQWWLPIIGKVDAAPHTLDAPVSLTNQGAAIAPTPIPLSSPAPGLYRVTFYGRVTAAAGVSSSLAVGFAWTDGGVSCSQMATAVTGNTTATVTSGSMLIQSDQASPISYTTTYASNPAGVMKYALSVTCERIA